MKNLFNHQSPLFITKSMETKDLITKSMDHGFMDGLKEFLLEGTVTNKNYDSPQIKDNTIILPNQLSNSMVYTPKDVQIIHCFKVINTDANSLVVPLRKHGPNSCLWHKYGVSPEHNNQDHFENKLINLGTLSTCPTVSREFLFKNDNFTHWLMEVIHNDIYNEICLSIFNTKEEVRSPYIESIFNGSQDQITSIKFQEKSTNVIESLKNIINEIPNVYRKKSKFFISRKFFNGLLSQLLHFNHPMVNFILNNNEILGYEYQIVEQLDDNIALFGDLSSAYGLIIKNDGNLERDVVTKKNFVQFFYAQCFGGAILNGEALKILKVE
jgi:HK97 family phage major capsid protein